MKTLHHALVAVALVAALAGSAAHATLTWQPGDTASFLGDSITAGVGYGPWYAVNYTPAVTAAYAKAGVAVSNSTATATTKVASASTSAKVGPYNSGPVILNAGVSGDTVAMMLARVNTDVIAHNPTVVIIEGGTNDLKNLTNIGTFTTNVSNLISTIKTALPSARLMWVGISCFGEQYPDPINATVNSYNAVIIAACASAGVTYVDERTPQQAYEAANNTPPPGVTQGLMTADEVHPNTTGVPIWGTAALGVTAYAGTP